MVHGLWIQEPKGLLRFARCDDSEESGERQQSAAHQCRRSNRRRCRMQLAAALLVCAAAATLAGWVVALSSWVVREIDQRRQPQRRR